MLSTEKLNKLIHKKQMLQNYEKIIHKARKNFA